MKNAFFNVTKIIFIGMFICINSLVAASLVYNPLTEIWRESGINRLRINNLFGNNCVHYETKFSPDGKMVVIVTDKGVQVSSIEEGSFLALNNSIKIDVLARSTAFSPDGKLLLLGTWDGRVILMNLLTLELHELYKDATYCEVYKDRNTAYLVAFSDDSKLMPDGSVVGTVASYFRSGFVKVFDFKTNVIKELRIADSWTCFMYALVFSHDGTMLAMGDQDGRLFLLNINGKNLSCSQLYCFKDSYLEVKALAFDATDSYLCSGSYASDMIIYDLKNSCVVDEKKNILNYRFYTENLNPKDRSTLRVNPNACTTNFSPDFTLVFRAGLNGSDDSQNIKIVNVSNSSELCQFVGEFDCLISDLVMSYDNKKIAFVSDYVEIINLVK